MSHTTLNDTYFNLTHRCPRGVGVSGPCNSISTIQYRETGDPVVDRILTLDEYRVDEGRLRQVDLYVLVSVHGGGHPASSQTPQVGCGSDTDNALTIKWPLLKNFLIIFFFTWRLVFATCMYRFSFKIVWITTNFKSKSRKFTGI